MKVKFHLPDFAGMGKFNMVFAAMLKNSPEFFREGVEIASVYGVFPPSLWNGGRFQGDMCNKNFVKAVINYFNGEGIPLQFIRPIALDNIEIFIQIRCKTHMHSRSIRIKHHDVLQCLILRRSEP